MTRPRAVMPASFAALRERPQTARSMPAGVTLAAVAATRSIGQGRPAEATGPPPAGPGHRRADARTPVAAQPAHARVLAGPVGPGRRTEAARLQHLMRGDIALVDHLDIDRVSAEELIAAGAVAVLN